MDSSLQQFNLPQFNGGKTQGTSPNPYLSCLIDPANNAMRLPDEYSNQTALYASRSYFDVYGNTAATTLAQDIGKFSYMIRPVIGNLNNNVNVSQVVNYNPAEQWPTAGNFSPITPTTYRYAQDPNLLALIGSSGTDGIVREIRPVAMSAWFQYTAPTITLGGHVACALTDGNIANYFVASPVPVQAGLPLQEYRNLSTLPNSYNGKIVDGCYAFYKPFDAEDIVFQNAHEPYVSYSDYGVAHTYPTIIISGQVISTTGSYSGVIGRIQVDIIFEYVTFSRLVESVPSLVNVPLLWNARQALQNVRTCMANDEHEGFFKRMLGYAKNLAIKAAPVIGGGLGSVLGGPAGLAAGRSIGNAISGALGGVQKQSPPPRSLPAPRPKSKKKKIAKRLKRKPA